MAIPLPTAFAHISDPRRETKNKLHQLVDILVIATCAVIANAESWEGIALYGQSKKDFFRRFLTLPNGIPSADTFQRVFAKLNPQAFSEAFGRWMASACEGTGLIPIAIDGKSVRGSRKASSTACLHLVSAWATQNRLTLGQVAVPEGSNEVGVIPELLRVLELKGAIVTLDAAGCQKEIAKQILSQNGDYLLAVKGNQPTLKEAVEENFRQAEAEGVVSAEHECHETIETGHGRTEKRTVRVHDKPKGLPPEWAGVKAVVRVDREREVKGVTTRSTRYDISSYRGTAAEMANLVRGHWGIENGLHWLLDVVFREDGSRKREGNAGANFAMIRKVALSLLRRAPGKGSTVSKRLKAGWDDDYLLEVLQGIPAEVVR